MHNLLRISEATSLALHAMTYLAAQEKQGLHVISTKEISEAIEVSEAHLSKVFQRLARSGLLTAQRGPKGGVMLSDPPSKTNLLSIYEAIEGPLVSSDCLLKSKVCKPQECVMGGLLESINKQIKYYLERTKLSDIAKVYM
ncbi:MAG: Rrf2 family transcriptional regulator [bacterium]